MSIIIRLTFFISLSILEAVAIGKFGFLIVHSSVAGIISLILSPGVFVIFFKGILGTSFSWFLLCLINVIYFESIYRLFYWRKKIAMKR